MKTTLQNKTYTIAGVVIIIILSLIFITVFPLILSIKKDSQKLVFIRQQILRAQAEMSDISVFREKYEEIYPNLVKIDSLFVDLKSPVDFIQFIERVSLESNVSTQITMPPDGSLVASGESLPSVQMQIISKGTRSDIIRLINKLESGPYLIEILGLDMRITAEKAGEKIGEKSEEKKEEELVDLFSVSFSIKIFTK
jgi:hypothetical protein